MKNLTGLLFIMFLAGCSGPEDGNNGKNGSSCSVQSAVNGAVIFCTDGSSSLITNGQDGVDGAPGATGPTGSSGQDGHDGLPGLDGRNGVDAITEIIDPCGNNPGQFDEILLRLGTGELLAYFESGNNRFLSLISPGHYSTTDSSHCSFTVHSNGSVTW